MGYETKCRVRVQMNDGSGTVREAAEAKVLIETDDFIVRGEARVKIPRTSIEKVSLRGGALTITAPNAIVTLTLDAETAAKWRKKLEEAPKRLIDKLDVKLGDKVWLLGTLDEQLVAQVEERTDSVVRGRAADSCAGVFVSVSTDRDLERIDRALEALAPRGAIWVVHPKGAKGVADTTIFAHGKKLGLVAIKVARVSDTHSADKLVRRR